jgi:hypothetical protein
VSALDAAVDAGNNAALGAPPWLGHDWFAPAIVAAIVGVGGSVLLFLLNRWSQDRLEALKGSMARDLSDRTERLKSDLTSAVSDRTELLKSELVQQTERLKSDLAGTVTERIERLKSDLAVTVAERTELLRHELAMDLTQRTRWADYIRGQIEKLYGPLAFLVESSARHIATNQGILDVYTQIYEKRTFSDDEEVRRKLDEEQERVLNTGNRYMELVVENNKEAIKILRAGWGWLDPDDIASAGQYLSDVARHTVEFQEEGRKLPFQFYALSMRGSSLGIVSFIRPEFIDRVRKKLLTKQGELQGLTGASERAAQ